MSLKPSLEASDRLKSDKSDLKKTLSVDSDENPADSTDSEEEIEFQPTKQKRRKAGAFSEGFQFASSVAEYNNDTWDDVMKTLKRRKKTHVDDALEKLRSEGGVQEDEVDLSEDDLVHDNFRLKESKSKKRPVKEEKTIVEEMNEPAKLEMEEVESGEQITSFLELNLSKPLERAINKLGFIHPTPIQAATIPLALAGRDICGCAGTGTGKTAAYMLPTLERLLHRPSNQMVTRVLVLVPTRELGVQVFTVTKDLGQFTRIETCLAVGGFELKQQESELRQRPDIVIATPGRLIDHLKNTPSFSLSSVEILILDEADRMLDTYFAEQMKEIIDHCSRTRQTMLFSATMTEKVQDLATVSLTKPVKVFVDSNQAVAKNLQQQFIRIRGESDKDREPFLAALICRTFHDHVIIFVQTKKQAHRLRILLGLLALKVGELHGNLTQAQRLEALKSFKDEEIDILVATDVAARGLDISGIRTVINFVMPLTYEHYIHRVGRTARAGHGGVSISLVGESERKILKDISDNAQKGVKQRIIPTKVIAKYKNRITALEPDYDEIVREEMEKKAIARAENILNRTKDKLEGVPQMKRDFPLKIMGVKKPERKQKKVEVKKERKQKRTGSFTRAISNVKSSRKFRHEGSHAIKMKQKGKKVR
ncbi:probable ATP-dependent RNA helicase DDX27 [Phlebotomus argentipes]|uniref:probable ATP-dependent RNA helicase DDX27 n=1 Tax=Phlebotomus argentipes TaxID=94469 RepID=UPI002892E2EB|nr:probable ATP-dependent RNA helicase DDX27 [Phlebotomus argentipes]